MNLRKPILLILIFLGLCAIGVSAYLQYGKPYMLEVEVQKQDEMRIADLGALDTALQTILTLNATTTLGNANTVYISIPSANPDCSDLELPSLSDGWSYHCAPSPALTNTDGTGWLPFAVDIATLPIDPINNPDTLNYYSFVTDSTSLIASTSPSVASSTEASTSTKKNSKVATTTATSTVEVSTTTQYVLTAVLDSKKYLTEKAQTDNGTDPIRYELGSPNSHSSSLWAQAQGLIGYWPINEGSGSLINDKSQYRNSAKLKNIQEWVRHDLRLSGSNFIVVNNNEILDKIGKENFNYTILASFKSDVKKDQSIMEKWVGTAYPFSLRGPNPEIRFSVYDGERNPTVVSHQEYSDSQWHQVTAGRNTREHFIFMYIDGKLIGKSLDDTADDISNSGAFPIGARYTNGQNSFDGFIKDVIIFNRILTSAEIMRLYLSLLADI